MEFIIFFISIFLHECSHIIVGNLFGYKLDNFKILPFGMYIQFKENKKNRYIVLKNIIIFLVGPITNFFISIVFMFVEIPYSYEIIYTNLILGIFNLLPLNPLDGSKILKEILKLMLGNKKGNIYSYLIMKTFLCIVTFMYSVLIIKIKNISFFIMILFFWYIDCKENRKLNTLIKAYDIIEKNREQIKI